MFNYILPTVAFLLVLGYLALFLHPAKAYIIPGLLGQIGLKETDFGATVVLTIIPILLILFLTSMAALPGPAGRRRYMGVLFVIGILVLTGYQTFLKAQPGGWPQTPPGVDVQIVTEHPFVDRIEAIGTTEANESTKLTSNVTETVKAIHFTEGEFVTKGTVIAELHDDEERANLVEAEKSYHRSTALARTSAISTARRDEDQARLDITKAQLKDRQIIVPFDGVLGLRSISVGDIVNPGTVITTLDDVDPMKVEFAIPESYLAAVRSGMRIDAKSEAYPGQVFSGTIIAIDPRIDPVTRSLKIKAEIPNADGKLRAGMLLVTNIVRNERQALAISEEAIVSMGLQKSVMVVGTPTGADKLADVTARPVQIGERMPGYVEIVSGLKPGETIVVNGILKAHPGAKVKINTTVSINDNIERAVSNAVPDKQTEWHDVTSSSAPETPATSASPASSATGTDPAVPSEPTVTPATSAAPAIPVTEAPDLLTKEPAEKPAQGE